MNISNNLPQINSNIGAQPNFKARLYLKNIDKCSMYFYKPMVKEFHAATKDLKGVAFTLTENNNGREVELVSNSLKGVKMQIPCNWGDLRSDILDTIITAARLLRSYETKEIPDDPSILAKLGKLLDKTEVVIARGIAGT